MTTTTHSVPFSLRDFLSSFLLLELFKGMALTGKYMFSRSITIQFPEEKTPLSPRFRGLHALRRYENCEESCPVDSIVETHIFEYHGEKRGDLYFTKEMLLAVGDRYEPEIAANKAADAKYR
jgi:NADH-quinone oxidoreductase subunit I